jgi:putative MATE family efflux protein
MNKTATLTEGSVGRTLISLTAPMVAGHFAIIAFNLADTYFVAQLGTRELAAMSFTFPVVMFVVSLTIGLGIGTGAIVSQAIGQGKHKRARRLTTDSLFLCILIVALCSTIGILTIEPLFELIGAAAETLPLVKTYMQVWYIGMIFVVVPMVGNSAIRATGDTKSPSLIMMISAGINVILDPLFIFGLAFFPRWGLFGAALATVIARATSLTFALIILHYRYRMLDFSMPRLEEVLDSWKRILFIGIPAAAATILFPISMAVLTRLAAGFSNKAVAAVGAGTRIETFALIVIMALSGVLVPFVGQNWGAKKLDRVIAAKKQSFSFSFLWGILVLAILNIAAVPLSRLFSVDPEVIRNISLYLRVASIGYGFLGIFRLASIIFNAISKPMKSLALNLIRMLALYIPFVLFGAWKFGFVGLLAGVALSNICAGIISVVWVNQTLMRAREDL